MTLLLFNGGGGSTPTPPTPPNLENMAMGAHGHASARLSPTENIFSDINATTAAVLDGPVTTWGEYPTLFQQPDGARKPTLRQDANNYRYLEFNASHSIYSQDAVLQYHQTWGNLTISEMPFLVAMVIQPDAGYTAIHQRLFHIQSQTDTASIALSLAPNTGFLDIEAQGDGSTPLEKTTSNWEPKADEQTLVMFSFDGSLANVYAHSTSLGDVTLIARAQIGDVTTQDSLYQFTIGAEDLFNGSVTNGYKGRLYDFVKYDGIYYAVREVAQVFAEKYYI